MKTKILLLCLLVASLISASCGGCPKLCPGFLTPMGPCTDERVFYHFDGEFPEAHFGAVDGGGCFQPDKDSIGECPGLDEITIDREEPQPVKRDGCKPFTLPLGWYAQTPSLGHIIGRADGDGWSATVGSDSANWLQYGPYTTQVLQGHNVAVWSLMIDNNTADNNTVLTLDVNDATTQTQLNSVQVTRSQFNASNTYQTFALPFAVDSSRAGHQFEFRVYWHGLAYVKEEGCGFVHMEWNASDPSLQHDLGWQDFDYLMNTFDAWTTSEGYGEGWMQHGPGTQEVGVGDNVALWTFLIANNSADNDMIVYLDVFDATTATIITSEQLPRIAWVHPNTYTSFGLPFTINQSQAGHQFEFRAYSFGRATLTELATGFTPQH